jgi:hypothetical protein
VCGLDSFFFAFSCFAEGRKKGAMITMREVFSGKYPIQSENRNPISINIKTKHNKKKMKMNRRSELEDAATLFSPKGFCFGISVSVFVFFLLFLFLSLSLKLNWVFSHRDRTFQVYT